MKKCGRFVAGMFGTSLSLAMLSGAFLMANKGAVEAEAADGDVVISLTNGDFGRSGTNAVLTAEKGGVSFEGKFRTTSDKGNDYDYLMFDKSGSYLTNTSTLAGYYVSNISWTYTNGTGVSGKAYYSFLDSSNNSVLTAGSAVDVVKGGAKSFANDNQSLGYFNISNSGANVQFKTIDITYSPVDSYDHITISGEPTKTQYYVGDSFLTDGLTVNAYKTAEDTDPIDVTDLVEWSVNPATFTDTATTSVTVTATFGDFTSEPYTVNGLTVLPAATVTDLVITGPTKATYKYGDDVDLAGLKIEAKMSDDKTVDITNEIEIADHTIDLADVAAGKYDIKVSYKGVEKTLSLTVDEKVLTTAEFSALAKDSKGIVSGTIIGVTDVYTNSSSISVYIQDNAGGLLLYSFSPDVVTGEVAIGNKIYMHGTRDEYGGVAQLTNADAAFVSGTGDKITPFEVTEFSADALDGKSNTLVTVKGLTYVSGDIAYLSSGQYKPGNVSMEFGSTKITLRAPTNAAAESMKDDFPTYVETRDGLPLNFTGILGWYNGAPQIAPISMSEFSCPVYDEIKAFIDTYMHMGKNEKDQCLKLFPEAKEAFGKLSETARECFLKYEGDNQEIVSASARYHAWSVAVGDQNAASVIMNTVNENKSAIIAVSAVAALGIVGAAALVISRKKRSTKNK